LFRFPPEWLAKDLYPDKLFEPQLACREPGNENASEHMRNGAFHWWIRQQPNKQQLTDLIELTFLDPDYLMGADVCTYLRQCSNYGDDHAAFVEKMNDQFKPPSWLLS